MREWYGIKKNNDNMLTKDFGKSFVKNGTHDKVMTPEKMAKKIINLYKIKGVVLDPCKGMGAFYNNFPKNCIKDFCEIDENKDFFKYNKKVDWIITNPPYSIFEEFLKHSQILSDNIVFLIPMSKAFSSLKRLKMIFNYGNIYSIHIVGASQCGFPFGFPACSLYIKKNYTGDTKILLL
tara:strand:+ start:1283 stop:1819 length:537 start_codon:yes stop_codon:yes gene_type:complete